MENVDEDAGPEFKWLKKKGVGGKNKEVQFYESFLYDGVEYTLYDCVYMYKEGLQEPYIGKLTKIWERAGKSKKVKVHWFFRPEEISMRLGNTKTLENEILFASGQGHGLANINSLEAIAGPCNVVCISKDCRNHQPSVEELKAADFVFYRTFNVQNYAILDTMDDKVGGLEINYIFNRKDGKILEAIPETTEVNATSSEPQQQPQQLSTAIAHEKLQPDPNPLKRNITPAESDKLDDCPLKKHKAGGKNPPEEKCDEPEVAQASEKLTGVPSKKFKVDNSNKMQVDVNNLKRAGTFGTNSEMGKTDIAGKDDRNASMVSVDNAENKERNKTPTGSGRLTNQPFKKQKSDVKDPPMVVNKSKHEEKLPADVNNLKALGTSGATEEKLNQKNGKVSSKVTDDSEGKIKKKLKGDGSAKLPDSGKGLVANSSLPKEKSKSGLALDSTANNKESKEEQSSEGKIIKKSNNDGSAKLPDNKKLGNSGSGKDLVASSLPKGKSKSGLALDSTVNNKESKEEQSSEGKVIKKSNGDGSAKLPDNKKLGTSGNGKDLVANSSLPKVTSKSGPALYLTANDKESKEEQSSAGKIKKKSNDDGSVKLPDNKKLATSGSGKDLVANSSLPKGTSKSGPALDSTPNNKESKEEQSSEGKIKKKSNDDDSAKLLDNTKLGNGGSGKDLVANSSLPKGTSESGPALDSTANNKESNEGQYSENKRKLTMNKSFKVPASLTNRDKKSAYQEFVCGPKPNDDKSSWFKQLPWDERLKDAYDQGKAILLHNVDPDYTSSEIEDIVWHAFNESCEAKIVQRTAVSSPNYGQAIILLKTKEAALKILVKLDKECLMLSNGRPLVATNCPPISTKKKSSFFGHLTLDKIKLQNQRDLDDAVSTSHFSQPNTIVYDMAMEWCLLQSRSKKWWDKTHKLQGIDLKNLESTRVQK